MPPLKYAEFVARYFVPDIYTYIRTGLRRNNNCCLRHYDSKVVEVGTTKLLLS